MLEKLRAFLSAEPFVPFTIHMTSGERYEVKHPENISLTKHFTTVTTDFDTDGTQSLYLLHIASFGQSNSVTSE